MNPAYTFTTISSKTPDQFGLVDIAFRGHSVDDRGIVASKLLDSMSSEVVEFEFIADKQIIIFNGGEINRLHLVDKLKGKARILLDITTLGLGEILNILLALKSGGHRSVEFIYAEPGEYSSEDSAAQGKEYKLTKNCRFQAIQGFAHEYQSNMGASHAFFFGFESGRMRNALIQRDIDDQQNYRIKVILGVPAFQCGWEHNSVVSHLNLLEEIDIREPSISYCQANSIRESYLTLWDLYRQLRSEKECFYVSPFGTKPQTVGAALFLLETKGSDFPTSLFYDHPERVVNRSVDIAKWHHFIVEIAS